MIWRKIVPLAFCLMPSLALAEVDRVTAELSKRSQIPVEDLEAAFGNCELNQRNLNLCAFRLAVSAEMAFDALQEELQIFEAADYAALKAETRDHCESEARESSGGGSLFAAEVSLCVAGSYRARHAAMVEIRKIEKAPHPPHKWD